MPDQQDIFFSSIIEDLDVVSKKIIAFAEEFKIWIFVGEMGVGKTTIIKYLCERLGVIDLVSSPTFSLVNEYEDVNGLKYFHFDFYRIENETEAMDIGIEEYFYSGCHCFIEWPEKIENLIPEKYLKIEIKLADKNSRRFFLSKHEQ
ncbi:tRNA (adenosine(37)-N6)-threonylcarbamoyltransferase complex ATPase subunit type 1 TsaE [soil metagenome]